MHEIQFIVPGNNFAAASKCTCGLTRL